MSGVIGSLGLGGGRDFAWERFMSSSTYSSSGIICPEKGSPSPCWIWVNLIPDRYDFMVLCFSACFPKYDAYLQSVFSRNG